MKKAIYVYESDLFIDGDRAKGVEHKTVFPENSKNFRNLA